MKLTSFFSTLKDKLKEFHIAFERRFLQGRAEDHWRGNTRKLIVQLAAVYLRGAFKKSTAL